MALVNPVDPSVQRVSACPVHFLWDGRGRGRTLVRAGFLGFLVAGMLLTMGSMLRLDGLTTAALVVVATAGASWLAGQVVTWRTARHEPRRRG